MSRRAAWTFSTSRASSPGTSLPAWSSSRKRVPSRRASTDRPRMRRAARWWHALRRWPRRCAGSSRSPAHARGSRERRSARARLLLVGRRHGGEVGAAVLLPGLLVVTRSPRLLRAEADGDQLHRLRAQLAEIALRRIGATLAERQVVLLGPALVAVALDADLQIGIAGEDVPHRRELLARIRGQGRRVELEEDADVAKLLHRAVELVLAIRGLDLGRLGLADRRAHGGRLGGRLCHLPFRGRLGVRAGREQGGGREHGEQTRGRSVWIHGLVPPGGPLDNNQAAGPHAGRKANDLSSNNPVEVGAGASFPTRWVRSLHGAKRCYEKVARPQRGRSAMMEGMG